MLDTFKTISEISEGYYKDKGSKFIAYAVPVDYEAQINKTLNSYKTKYYDAKHHCYAYKIGIKDFKYRINDDGEPSGTAGKPIYRQIQSLNLTNILIIVIRYFGGILLGTSGLIKAYKSASHDALNNATIIEKTIDDEFVLKFFYDDLNNVMRIINGLNCKIINQDFTDKCFMRIALRKSKSSEFIDKIYQFKNVSVEVNIL